jgi:sugar phosphate isomerase/epimerase
MSDATSGLIPADRRNFLLGTGAAAGAMVLGAPLRTRAADRVEITFASAKFFGKETLAEVVEAYNQAQSKVHVTYVELPPPSSSTEVHQALVQQLARRTGTPDVFTQDVVWIAEFAGAGWALPLGEYFDAKAQQDYFPGTIDACTYQGKLTALPWFVDSGMLYYRKDLLEGAGAKVPETWADLTKTAQELMKAGKADFGYLWQGKQAEVLVCDLISIIASNNGAILTEDGKSSRLNDAKAVEAVQYLYDTIHTTKISPTDVLSWDEEPSRQPFTAGKGAFLRNWSYVYSISQDAKASAVVGKVGVAPLPHFAAGGRHHRAARLHRGVERVHVRAGLHLDHRASDHPGWHRQLHQPLLRALGRHRRGVRGCHGAVDRAGSVLPAPHHRGPHARRGQGMNSSDARQLRVGCQTYTWEMLGERWTGGADDLLKAVTAGGYAGIEITDTMIGHYAGRPDAFAWALAEHGLTLVAFACGSASGFTEPAALNNDLAAVDHALDFVARFPGALLSLGSATVTGPGPREDKFAAAARFYNAAGERGRTVGVQVALHPSSHHNTLLGTRAEYDRIMALTDPSLIGWVPDTGHILRGGQDILDTLRTYQDRIRYLHLKDVDAAGRWSMLGEGVCDTTAVIEVIGVAPDFNGWLVLEEESETAAKDPAAAVRRNRDTLRALGA